MSNIAMLGNIYAYGLDEKITLKTTNTLLSQSWIIDIPITQSGPFCKYCILGLALINLQRFVSAMHNQF